MSNHKIDKEVIKQAASTPVHADPDGFRLESVGLRTVWMTTLGLTALLLVSIVIVELMTDWKRLVKGFSAYTGHPMAPMAEKLPPYQGKPVLQVDEFKDLTDYRESEKKRLNGWGWVDKSAGVAHVPIVYAMKRVLSKGLPARGSASAAPQGKKGSK